MSGLLQIFGALLVLVPFAALQLHRLRADSLVYLWLNLLGSSLLAILAAQNAQWGFLLLEGAWALVSVRGLLGRGT